MKQTIAKALAMLMGATICQAGGSEEDDFSKEYMVAQSAWKVLSATTVDGCGLGYEDYLTVFGTDDELLDSEVFDWANGQYDEPARADDDCLDQVEFKRLFLFKNGGGDKDLIDYLDARILPNYQGLMDKRGYLLYKLASELLEDEMELADVIEMAEDAADEQSTDDEDSGRRKLGHRNHIRRRNHAYRTWNGYRWVYHNASYAHKRYHWNDYYNNC